MANAFQQLRQTFQALGKEISPEISEEAKNCLSQWLASNAQELLKRKTKAEINGTMMQYFHWYLPSDGKHWKILQQRACELAEAGFTALWLPPAFKGSGGIWDVGYGIYDLFDLGEFDQKGTVRTKYGTKDEYVNAVQKVQQEGLQIYADIVFNHKMGGDGEEEFEAIPCDYNDRNRAIGGLEKIKSWTRFDFPGRGNNYSSMKWHWWHFDSVDYNSYNPNYRAVFRIKDKSFDTKVDLNFGNLMNMVGANFAVMVVQFRFG